MNAKMNSVLEIDATSPMAKALVAIITEYRNLGYKKNLSAEDFNFTDDTTWIQAIISNKGKTLVICISARGNITFGSNVKAPFHRAISGHYSDANMYHAQHLKAFLGQA